jgi:hypothetical protein
MGSNTSGARSFSQVATAVVPDPEAASEIFAALAGARIFDRALLLNIVPDAEERAILLENALSIFGYAYAARPKKASIRRRRKSRAT